MSIYEYSALIVDDEQDICDICKDFLGSMAKFKHIIMANDGLAAINKLNNQNFDLLIIDIGLPKKDGFEVLEHIEKYAKKSMKNVVVLSGQIDKHKLDTAKRLGVKHYLVKPVNKERFTNTISKIITVQI